jgi:magnesium transporter
MTTSGTKHTSVSALLGTPVLDPAGKTFGRIREFVVAPLVDATRVTGLLVRRADSSRGTLPSLVSMTDLTRDEAGTLRLVRGADPQAVNLADDHLLLERDLLDQQIIDVHGHKVVRVNDVDMFWETHAHADQGSFELTLRIAEVEVGMRGAVRRLLKGLPGGAVDRIACRAKPSVIPWDFVDLIDRDPARRVRLKIEQDRLAKMHPSDLADILEELAPAERDALFSSLDEEVAADTLEEVDLKTQKTLIESLDTERVAGIIEEMDPGAAADLLSELTEERSDAILEEMDEKERQDVEELLDDDHSPDSAAGLMTSEIAAVLANANVGEAFTALRSFEGDLDAVTDLFLIDDDWHYKGQVPLSKLLLAAHDTPLMDLHESGHTLSADSEMPRRKVAELFDKYNLRCLAVLDDDQRLAGIIHAEDVITWLRSGH